MVPAAVFWDTCLVVSDTLAALKTDIETAIRILREGGVVCMPTDTLYALTAPATAPNAVVRVYKIKGRELDKPLPLFVSDAAMAGRISEVTPMARRLMDRFWPGALTVVVPRKQSFDSLALSGGDTIALRVPDNGIARRIIEAAGVPVTATSANLSGGANPSTAQEVERQIGDGIDYLLDGGECEVGLPSTIVDCTGERPVILREGAVSLEAIEAALAEEA